MRSRLLLLIHYPMRSKLIGASCRDNPMFSPVLSIRMVMDDYCFAFLLRAGRSIRRPERDRIRAYGTTDPYVSALSTERRLLSVAENLLGADKLRARCCQPHHSNSVLPETNDPLALTKDARAYYVPLCEIRYDAEDVGSTDPTNSHVGTPLVLCNDGLGRLTSVRESLMEQSAPKTLNSCTAMIL